MYLTDLIPSKYVCWYWLDTDKDIRISEALLLTEHNYLTSAQIKMLNNTVNNKDIVTVDLLFQSQNFSYASYLRRYKKLVC